MRMSTWRVELHSFEECTSVHKELEEVKKCTGKAAIEMEIKFPDNYPFAAPFVRVVRPLLIPGRVVDSDGSVVIEMLTEKAWRPTYSTTAIVETIRQEIATGGSKVAFKHTS